jgi:iron complex transport system permease protein
VATETETEAGGRYGERFGWLDRSLAMTCLGSLAVAVLAGLIQVSYGTFSMSVLQAWSAVLDPLVWTNPGVLVSFLFGDAFAESLGFVTDVDLPKETLIVWNIRLPRVVVAAFVGFNLAVSGAIFQAVTRNELASPFILGVSSGAGFAVLVTLVLVPTFAAFLPLTAALGGAVAFVIVYAIAW